MKPPALTRQPAPLATKLLAVPLIGMLLVGCSSNTPEPVAAPPAADPEPEPEPAAYVPGPSADDIRVAVSGRDADLRQCYIAGTLKNAQLTGTVNVLFTIDTKGKVRQASDAGSDIRDAELVECVLDVFGKLEFAAGATTDTEVTYPVRFMSHG